MSILATADTPARTESGLRTRPAVPQDKATLRRAFTGRCAAAAVRAGGAGRLPRRARRRASCISISARRRSRSASARICGPSDWITSTHRGHGHALAKGMDPEHADGRTLRQARRLLRRPRRHDASLRPRESACSAPTGSSAAASPRRSARRSRAQVRGTDGVGGRLLRRRRDQPRRLPRGAELRRRAARARGLRLREQSLRHRDGRSAT